MLDPGTLRAVGRAIAPCGGLIRLGRGTAYITVYGPHGLPQVHFNVPSGTLRAADLRGPYLLHIRETLAERGYLDPFGYALANP